MGRTVAEGMAEAVREGYAGLRSALYYHLIHNHYPPHPTFMIDVALAAIEAANDEDWDRIIDLPKDDDGTPMVEWRDGRTAIEASLIIESLHLEDFIGLTTGEDGDE